MDKPSSGSRGWFQGILFVAEPMLPSSGLKCSRLVPIVQIKAESICGGPGSRVEFCQRLAAIIRDLIPTKAARRATRVRFGLDGTIAQNPYSFEQAPTDPSEANEDGESEESDISPALGDRDVYVSRPSAPSSADSDSDVSVDSKSLPPVLPASGTTIGLRRSASVSFERQ